MVKLWACGAGLGSNLVLATMILEIGYLRLPSDDMTEIKVKRKKIINPTFMLLVNIQRENE